MSYTLRSLAVACLAWTALPALAAEEIHAPVVVAAIPAPVSPWEAEFAAFASSDQARPPQSGGILFVGSSSIRLWTDLEKEFGTSAGIIKRGFGGSQLGDCVKNLERLVVKYQPRTVLVYAGDNDLAAGVAPAEVERRFVAFVDGVRAKLPGTRIAYISIKPSPSRSALMPQIRATNDLIRAATSTRDHVEYIDIFTPMLGSSGEPRRELFLDDALHLNADGYSLWKRVIAPYVAPG